MNIEHIKIGDFVCFGERLGEFGKKPLEVLGIRQDEEGTFIKTDYGSQYSPINMFEKCV